MKNKTKVKSLLTLASVSLLLFSCSAGNENAANKQSQFYVRGNCGMCEERIEKAVNAVEGVSKVDWVVETKQLSVAYDSTKISELRLQQTVADVGHETNLVPSPQAVHDALPECCKKGSTM